MTATYWLISLPARDSNGPQRAERGVALSQLRTVVAEVDANAGLEMTNLALPELKVGTLDSLVVLSDELGKYDTAYESFVIKLVETLKNALQQNHGNTNIPTLNDSIKIGGHTVDDYLRSFQWNSMKYRPDKPLKEIVNTIQSDMANLEAQLKAKSTQHQAMRNSLISIERKVAGNLSVRSLSEIVGPEHAITGSEFLTTRFIAVPKNLAKTFENSYETLAPMVVPRSAKKITEDSEYILYSVVIFRKTLNEFSEACRKQQFTIREFEFSEEKAEENRREAERVRHTELELWRSLVQWCQASFQDAFTAWFHVKVLRAFTESVLRYGLPPDYVFALIKPRYEDKLTTKLNEVYGYLAGSRGNANSQTVEDPELPSMLGIQDDNNYSPFTKFGFVWNYE